MPLGVFAVSSRADDDHPAMMMQMAVSKEGNLAGMYYNTSDDVALPIQGAVDQKTQRAAWTIGDKKNTVLETGIFNLTKEETPVLVHFGDEKTQNWMMVRLDKPESASQDVFGPPSAQPPQAPPAPGRPRPRIRRLASANHACGNCRIPKRRGSQGRDVFMRTWGAMLTKRVSMRESRPPRRRDAQFAARRTRFDTRSPAIENMRVLPAAWVHAAPAFPHLSFRLSSHAARSAPGSFDVRSSLSVALSRSPGQLLQPKIFFGHHWLVGRGGHLGVAGRRHRAAQCRVLRLPVQARRRLGRSFAERRGAVDPFQRPSR